MELSIFPGVLQSCVIQILDSKVNVTVIVYCDDILIFTKGSRDEHLEVKLRKVALAKDEVTYLGMELSTAETDGESQTNTYNPSTT